MTLVSLGLVGTLPADDLAALTPHVEAAGLHALWLNVGPGGEAFTGLAAAGSTTERLRLATGVVPVSEIPPTRVVEHIADAGLPVDRLVLGVGSGRSSRPLPLMAAAIGDLEATVAAPVLLGALGPKMRGLAAVRAEGALLSWLSPALAASTARELREAGIAGERTVPRAVLYARTTVDPSASAALAAETATYAGYPSYAANFARLSLDPADTTIEGSTPQRLADGIRAYREHEHAVDELVLRAIVAEPSVDAYRRFVDAVAAAV